MEYFYSIFENYLNSKNLISMIVLTGLMCIILRFLKVDIIKTVKSEFKKENQGWIILIASILPLIFFLSYIVHLAFQFEVFEYGKIISLYLFILFLVLPLIFLSNFFSKIRKFYNVCVIIICIALFSIYLGANLASRKMIVDNEKSDDVSKQSFLFSVIYNQSSKLERSKLKKVEEIAEKVFEQTYTSLSEVDPTFDKNNLILSTKIKLRVKTKKRALIIGRELNINKVFSFMVRDNNLKTVKLLSAAGLKMPNFFQSENETELNTNNVDNNFVYTVCITSTKNDTDVIFDNYNEKISDDTRFRFPPLIETTISTNNYTKLIDFSSFYSLGSLAYIKKYYRHSISYFDEALNTIDAMETTNNIEETRSEIHRFIGASFFRLDDYDKSIENLQYSLKNDSTNMCAYVFLGRAYFAKENDSGKVKNFDRAFEMINKALSFDSSYAYGLYNRENLYAKIDEYDNAIHDYEKAIKIDPKLINAKNNLAVLNIKSDNYKRAEKLLKEINEKNPNYAIAFYNIACSYARQDRVDDAVDILTKNFDLLAKPLPDHSNTIPLIYAQTDPDLKSIHTHPKFLKIVEKAKKMMLM